MSHRDKLHSSNQSIPKDKWERIFGKFKPSEKPEHLKNPRPKPRVGRDNITNRDVRWV